MNKVSAVIITKNEEENLKDCLDSLQWVDEIVVIDSYSDDNTIEIAKRYTNQVYKNEWSGYAQQRNYGANIASHNWIISIDADERISEELANEIRETLSNPKYVAYNIPMQNYVFNRWMKHSGLGKQYHIRLYNKTLCKWDSLIHEDIETNGEVGKLNHKMLHLAYKNVSELMYKIDKYTDLEAEKLVASKKNPSLIKFILYPPVIFIYKYFYQQGFRDGVAGFAWAISLFYYHNVKFIKYFLKKDALQNENTNIY
jgi:glycosyltransferase involved in cell wall biosynthesis